MERFEYLERPRWMFGLVRFILSLSAGLLDNVVNGAESRAHTVHLLLLFAVYRTIC